MGESATTVNKPIEVVDTVLKELLDLGLQALETAMNLYAPFTAIPILKQIIDLCLSWIEEQLYTGMIAATNYVILKFETFIEKTNYLLSVADLKAAQINGDPLLIKAAKLAFADAASSLIHSDGSYKS